MAALALSPARRAVVCAALATATLGATMAAALANPDALARWAERYHRLPALVLAPPQRASISLGDGALQPLKLSAAVLETRALPTSTPIVSIVPWRGGLVVASFGDGAWLVRGEQLEPLPLGVAVNALAAGDALWAATNDGAYRFDGMATRLASGAFTAVALWRGQPWFTSPRGISTLDSQGFVTYGADHGLAPMRPSALAACGAQLCIGAEDGLWLFDGERATRLTSASGALPADEVAAVTFDGSAIWAGTFDAGLARVGTRRFAPQDGLADGRVEPRALSSWHGLTLAGTPSGLVVLRDGSSGVVLRDLEVTAIALDGDALWIGSAGRIARVEVRA